MRISSYPESRHWLLTFRSIAILGVLLAVSIGTSRAQSPVSVKSDQGIEAWLIRDHSSPIISLKLRFQGGAASDPPDKGGLSRLVAASLTKGAGKYDSQSFKMELEDRAVRLSFISNAQISSQKLGRPNILKQP